MTSTENIISNIASEGQAVVVLRILTGAMRSAEFELTFGHTLVVADSASAFEDERRLSTFPDNAIIVPLDQGACSFEVVVTTSDDGIHAMLRESHPTDGREHACPFNSVITFGALTFAVKPLGDSWSAHVLNDAAALPAVTMADKPSAAERTDKSPMPLMRRSMHRNALIAALLLAILGVALATAYWIHDSTERQQTRLSDLLMGSVGEYQVVKGKDDVFYVFADTLRDASWARQALVRSDFNAPTKVLYIRSEKIRIQKLLDHHHNLNSYHILRLDDPATPRLLLSAERGPRDPKARARAAQEMKALLPYATEVRIGSLKDADVALDAQRGLDQLGIVYKRIDKTTSVTFEIQPILDDSGLQKLRPYVDAFYQRWGQRYVHFSVDLKDDWLKGKSFSYGDDSYVKLNNSHWYFSRTLH